MLWAGYTDPARQLLTVSPCTRAIAPSGLRTATAEQGRGPRADAHRRSRGCRIGATQAREARGGTDASCCRVDRKTGQKECKKEFCHKAFKERANQRMGHVLRRMHELGHVELSVEQQVAVDILSPHIHSDKRCRSKHMGAARSSADVSELECVASSIATHIAAKHGISSKAVDDELGKYGLSVAKMIAQPLKMATFVPVQIESCIRHACRKDTKPPAAAEAHGLTPTRAR